MCKIQTFQSLEQKLIYEGKMFTSSGQVIDELAVDGEIITRIQAPLKKHIFIKGLRIKGKGSDLLIELFRDITIVDGGLYQENAYRNMNHNSDKVAETKIYIQTPVYPITWTGGYRVEPYIIHGDSSQLVTSSDIHVEFNYSFLVTKNNNENYILRMTNIGDDVAKNILIASKIHESTLGLY